MGVHHAVIVHHCGHEAGGEGVAIHEGNGGHWVAISKASLSTPTKKSADGSRDVNARRRTHVNSLRHSGYRLSAKKPFVFIADS